MRTPLVHDRNGDPVYEDTPLHMKGEKVPTNRIRQDKQRPECVIVTDLNGEDDPRFCYANGSVYVPRILKEKFKDQWWQVRPYD